MELDRTAQMSKMQLVCQETHDVTGLWARTALGKPKQATSKPLANGSILGQESKGGVGTYETHDACQ
jgi:hypothetical protein